MLRGLRADVLVGSGASLGQGSSPVDVVTDTVTVDGGSKKVSGHVEQS